MSQILLPSGFSKFHLVIPKKKLQQKKHECFIRERAFSVNFGQITLVWMSVANVVPIHRVDMKEFDRTRETFDLLQ